MKKIIFLLVLFVSLSRLSFSQAPNFFNYQAVARNAAGQGLSNQNISLRVSILNGSASGNSEYSETFNTTTSSSGLFTLAIGSGTPLLGNFETVDWGTGKKWMKIEIDVNGSNNYVVMGTSQLLSVPYALYAKHSGSTLKAGPGIGLAGDTIINTSPDKIVSISGSERINVSGTYPAFALHDKLAAGAGVQLVHDTIINTAPDKIVHLTSGGNISVTGTYPDFKITSYGNTAKPLQAGKGIILAGDTIINASPDKDVHLNAGKNIMVSGNYPDFTIAAECKPLAAGEGIAIRHDSIINTAPNKDVHITGGKNIVVTGAYPDFTIASDGASPNLLTAGDGIKISHDSIINIAPDKDVHITAGKNILVSGKYPDFTITSDCKPLVAGDGIRISHDSIINAAPDQMVTLQGTGSVDVSGSYPHYTVNSKILAPGKGILIRNDTIINSGPEKVNLKAGQNISITGNYPDLTISATGGGSSSGLKSFNFPDGFDNIQPQVLNLSSPYTVPAGQNLYINNTSYCDSLHVNGIYTMSPYGGFAVGENDVVRTKAGGSCYVNGFLIPKQVSWVSFETKTPYTVPAGKILIIIFSKWDTKPNPGVPEKITINGQGLNNYLGSIYFAKAGDVIGSTGGNFYVNGYLK